MSSRWYAVCMVWIVSSVLGSCLAALYVGWCWVSFGFGAVSGNGGRVSGVDCWSSLVGRCVHGGFLGLHLAVFPGVGVSCWLFHRLAFP